MEKPLLQALIENTSSRRTAASLQKMTPKKHAAIAFAKTWASYIDGQIVSQHARQLIQNFLSNVSGRDAGDESGQEEGDRSDVDEEIPHLEVKPDELQQILASKNLFVPVETEEGGGGQSEKTKGKPLRAEYARAAARSEMLWQTPQREVDGSIAIKGEMYGGKLQEYVKARNAGEEDEAESRPYAGKTAPRAELYVSMQMLPDQWHRAVLNGIRRTRPDVEPMRANQEQGAVLRRVVDRVVEEKRLEQTSSKALSEVEPIRDLVHGSPGTGKSAMTGWLRDLFENVLGWEHGVQFVFLSFQNTMAADINGFTIHHWAGINPLEAEGSSTTKDSHHMSTKCQNLRFIIIDEISMVSAQLLGSLEIIVRRAVRKKSGYKLRPDGTERAFGGVNLIALGDFWQLPPVSGTPLCAHPDDVALGVAELGYNLLWERDFNGIQKTFNLTEPMRCDDAWYNGFLNKCRHGSLDLDTYSFFHGLPTIEPVGSAQCTCQELETRLQDFLVCGESSLEIRSRECASCRSEREKRARVIPGTATTDDEKRRLARVMEDVKKTPFVEAPAIYAYNVPKWSTLLLRAREYAKQRNQCLCWSFAHDVAWSVNSR
jgi:ATP-dependent DNA helicase PIF1